MRKGILIFALISGAASEGHAGAWPVLPGATQLIGKFEDQYALEPVQGAAQTQDIIRTRDERLTLFIERGLTEATTLQANFGLARGVEGGTKHDGFAPVSFGVRSVLFKSGEFIASGYVGATVPGIQVSNRFDTAKGHGDLEFRGLIGWTPKWLGKGAYVELDLARLAQLGAADQTRLDFTLGKRIGNRWLQLTQIYAGQVDGGPSRSQWVKLDQTIIRKIRGWTVQTGWRYTLAGRNIPIAEGPVIAIWKTF